MTEQGKHALTLKGYPTEAEAEAAAADSEQIAETKELLDLHRKRKRQKEGENLLALLPQGEGSGLNADLLDGLHARDIIDKVTYKAPSGPTFGGGGGGLTQHGNEFHTPDFSEVTHNHNLNDLTEKLHASLAGVTANQHHNQLHNLASADHPDVSIVAPADTEVLTFEGATSLWKNKPAGGTTKVYATKLVGFSATCDYVCDGVADEVQINQAVTAVSGLGGGMVLLREGTYNLAATITCLSSVTIKGMGSATVLQPAIGIYAFTGSNKNTVWIMDMRIYGQSRANTRGVSWTQMIVCGIVNVTFYQLAGYGMYFAMGGSACSGIWIDKCYIYNCGYGIYSTTQNESFMITNNIISCCITYNAYFNNNCKMSTFANNDLVSITTGNNLGFNDQCNNWTVSGNFIMNYGSGYSIRTSADCYQIVLVGNVIQATLTTGMQPLILIDDCYTIEANGNVLVVPTACTGIVVSSASYSISLFGNVIKHNGTTAANYGIQVVTGANTLISIIGNTIRCGATPLAGISLADVTYAMVSGNTIYGFATSITLAATASNCTVIHNSLQNPASTRISDGGVNTALQTVLVPFTYGYDMQQSGILVNGEEDYADTWTMLPVEVQQVVRAKVYARSGVAETHAMEADFTIYGAADNEAYTTNNGSVAGLASTSTNFAADDVIYWTITAAGLLTMTGKDSIQARVDGAIADGDNCATNAYFRTLEIEYV